jgi:hypothetical protein
VYEDEHNKHWEVEEIDGIPQWWYRINFNEIDGYIFGGYITMKKIAFDIDKNGMMDYFCFRFDTVWVYLLNNGEGSDEPNIIPNNIYIYKQ